MSREVSFLSETQCVNCNKTLSTNLILTALTEEQMQTIHQIMINHVKMACNECYPKIKKAVESQIISEDIFIYLGE